jgi:hypothetical protein
MNPQENAAYESVRREIDILKADICATKILAHNDNGQPISLQGQYKRKPIPARLGVEIPVPLVDPDDFDPQTYYEGIIDINSDGDFVATGVYFFFKLDIGADSFIFGNDVGGLWRYASSIRIFPAPGFFVSQIGIQDIYWEYDVSRSHRFRQNIPVPASLPTMAEEGNGFFPLVPQDIFPRGETVTIRITPTHPLWIDDYDEVGWSGIFWCGFNGFYILDD